MQRQECLVGPRGSEDTNVAGAGGARRKMEGHEDREELRPDLGGPSRLQWKTPTTTSLTHLALKSTCLDPPTLTSSTTNRFIVPCPLSLDLSTTTFHPQYSTSFFLPPKKPVEGNPCHPSPSCLLTGQAFPVIMT